MIVVGLVLGLGVPPAQAEVFDTWWTEDAVDTVLTEMVLLHEAGAFTADPLLDTMVSYHNWGYVLPEDRYELTLDLYDLDQYGMGSLTDQGAPTTMSVDVEYALGPIDPVTRNAISSGQLAFIDPEPYFNALGDLLRRYGQPPTAVRDPLERTVIEAFVIDYADYSFSLPIYADPTWESSTTATTFEVTTSTVVTSPSPTVPPSTPVTTQKASTTTASPSTSTTQTTPLESVTTVGLTTSALTGFAAADAGAYGPDVTGAAADAPAGSATGDDSTTEIGDGSAGTAGEGDDGADPVAAGDGLVDLTSGSDEPLAGPGLWSAPTAILTVLAAAGAAGVWLVVSRRRGGGADFRLIAETSRKLAGAQNEAEVIETAVLATVQFTGARAGAYHRLTPAGLKLAGTTSAEVFPAQIQERGTLVDIANAGQPLRAVVEGDPAFTPPSLALAAAPVVNDGQITGVLVVAREPSSPFGADAIETLGALAPMLGSALHSTMELETAMQGSELDWLTSLPNRRKFDHDVARAAESLSRISVAMVDVDHFKSFNDTYGHETGDLVLREVARTIASTIRPVDTVYRYGGEEFSVLLADCEEDEAGQVMERVRLSVQQMVLPESLATRETGGTTVTVSVGLASGLGVGITDLLAIADQSLYAAKHNGRNRVAVGQVARAS